MSNRENKQRSRNWLLGWYLREEYSLGPEDERPIWSNNDWNRALNSARDWWRWYDHHAITEPLAAYLDWIAEDRCRGQLEQAQRRMQRIRSGALYPYVPPNLP